MKILLVDQALNSWTKKDLEIFQSVGHQVRVVQFRGPRDMTTLLRGTFWADLSFTWFGKLHAFFTVLVSKLLSKKAIVVAGGDDVACEPEINYGMCIYWWKKWCPLFVFHFADLIFCVSEFTRQETIKNVMANPAKVRLLYHGFDASEWQPIDGVSRKNLVLTVGFFGDEAIRIKGLELFVQSAKQLPDVQFTIVGPWRDSSIDRLKAIAPSNLTFSFGLYGEDLRQMYSRAKIYLQASIRESFCCSVAEAMLCGCVPIVSQQGALPEVVGNCGFYFDKRTPEAIVTMIKEALQKPEVGQAARQRVMQLFSLEARQKLLLSALDELGIYSDYRRYQMCARCVMDTTDPYIYFDENGICNHCKLYEERVKNELTPIKEGQNKLETLLAEVKKKGKNKEYDCIIGVSGGVDSTMVAYLTKKKFGLRPLAVHLDNGWDTELAVNNIEKVIKRLGIDLYTYVLDWEEFKDLQLSFLRSSIINAEIPTDHAITTILFRRAKEMNISYIFGGSNLVTEGLMPHSWVYDHRDWKLIKGIQKKFSNVKLKTYPHYNFLQMLYYIFIKRIKYIPILNYIEYNKKEAINLLQNELGWEYYEGKHYESLYTRFYQSYILPSKFNVDKRKAHLSTLILSGQMEKEEAIEELKKATYPPDLLQEDKEYVTKKLGLTEDEFEDIMALPIRTFKDYPNSYFVLTKFSFLIKFVKKVATYNY